MTTFTLDLAFVMTLDLYHYGLSPNSRIPFVRAILLSSLSRPLGAFPCP